MPRVLCRFRKKIGNFSLAYFPTGVWIKGGGGEGRRAGPVGQGHPLSLLGDPQTSLIGGKNVACMNANPHILLGYLNPPPPPHF